MNSLLKSESWAIVLLLAGLLIPGLAPLPLHAQAPPFVVDQQAVVPQFPDGITFSLDAHVAGGRTITRATVSYQAQGDPYTRGVAAQVSPAARVAISATADTQVNYIPPGVTVDYYWTLEDSAGGRFDTPRAAIRYDDTRATWQTRIVQGVNLHWQGTHAAYGDLLTGAVGGAATHLQALTGLTLPLPVEVWVYPSGDDLRGALPPGEPEWVGGQAFAQARVVLAAIADDDKAAAEAKRVLPHELAHIAVAAATRNPYNTPPTWLDEGVAVNNQQDDDPFLAALLERAARARALLPLRTLESSFPANPDQATLSYAESASAVHFLLDRYGGARIQRLLTAFQQGITYDAALQQVVGLTTDQLEAAWRATLPQPVGPTPAPTPSSAPPSPPTAGATPPPATATTLLANPDTQPPDLPSGSAGDALPAVLLGAGACIAGLVLIVIIVGVVWLVRRGARRA